MTSLLNLGRIRKLLKGKKFSMSENIYNLVYTVDNYFIAIRALNAHGTETIQPILPHRAPKRRSPLNERSAKHGVAGMTGRMDATFENSGVIS